MDDSKVYDGFVHILSFSVKSRGGSRFSARALDLGASVEIEAVTRKHELGSKNAPPRLLE